MREEREERKLTPHHVEWSSSTLSLSLSLSPSLSLSLSFPCSLVLLFKPPLEVEFSVPRSASAKTKVSSWLVYFMSFVIFFWVSVSSIKVEDFTRLLGFLCWFRFWVIIIGLLWLFYAFIWLWSFFFFFVFHVCFSCDTTFVCTCSCSYQCSLR